MKNEKRILAFLRLNKKSSRQAIADALGLSKNTISVIVDKLLREGLVTETGRDQIGVGRPRIELSLVPQASQAIGILVRDTECEIVVTDYTGDIMESQVVSVDSTVPDKCLGAIVLHCSRLAESYDNIIGMGIAIPGLVDPVSGFVHYSTHLKWRNVPVMDIFTSNFPSIPIKVLNRVKAAALSRLRVVPEDAGSTFYIRIDEGVGGAFVIGNEIYHGNSWTAGEVGHLPVVEDGPLCTCGQHGCLEALVSLPSVLKSLGVGDGVASETGSEHPELQTLVGHPELSAVLAQVGTYVGIAASMVINLLNPQFIVIDSPYTFESFSSEVVHIASARALRHPADSTHFLFVNTIHSSASGMALAVILDYENVQDDVGIM